MKPSLFTTSHVASTKLPETFLPSQISTVSLSNFHTEEWASSRVRLLTETEGYEINFITAQELISKFTPPEFLD